MKFSVIVPVYKVAEYLPQCVESVCGQSFVDWELILVDDGSPDRCGELCDTYAQRDARITVVHQQNKGLPGARNSGIDTAKGDWLLFLDGDDYMPDAFLERLYQKMQAHSGADVYIGNYVSLIASGKIIPMRGEKPFVEGLGPDGSLRIRFLHCYRMADVCAWKMAVRKEWLQESGLRFAQEVRYAEDVVWSLQLFLLNPSVYYLNLPFVVYRADRPGSITHAVDHPLKNMEMRILAWKKFQNGRHNAVSQKDRAFAEGFAANKVVGEFQAQIKFGDEPQRQQAILLMQQAMPAASAVTVGSAGVKRTIAAKTLKLLGANRFSVCLRMKETIFGRLCG